MDDRLDFRNTPPLSSSVVMERLELSPATASIQLPDSQSYIAIGRGSDGKYYPVTAGTTFTFQQTDGAPTGSCPDGTCRPLSRGNSSSLVRSFNELVLALSPPARPCWSDQHRDRTRS
jgi:hypothetical protein